MEEKKEVKIESKEYLPHGISDREKIPVPNSKYNRRRPGRNNGDMENVKATKEALELTGNKELQRLTFYGAGPKMPGLGILSNKEELPKAPKKKRKYGLALPDDDPVCIQIVFLLFVFPIIGLSHVLCWTN